MKQSETTSRTANHASPLMAHVPGDLPRAVETASHSYSYSNSIRIRTRTRMHFSALHVRLLTLLWMLLKAERIKPITQPSHPSTADDFSFLPHANANLPVLLGKHIYALVRPKHTPLTEEERIAAEYQQNALERIVRCRVNGTLCFTVTPPKPRIDYGKFCWTAQRFEPLRAGISQLRCRTPPRPSEENVSSFWQAMLAAEGNDIELEMSVTNYFLVKAHNGYNQPPRIRWRDLLNSPISAIPALLAQTRSGSDPLDPLFPLNPLAPYSPLNPFMKLNRRHHLSPHNPDSPLHPMNPASPFSVLNPANPFNQLSPVLALPPSHPMSPYNPASPYFPLDPHSPYNPASGDAPINPASALAAPPPHSPFSPLNGAFMMHPNSPLNPLGPLGQLPLLPESDPNSPLNPSSPFYPIHALNPQNPLPDLSADSPLSPLNLALRPFNLISGEEIPISLKIPAPAYIRGTCRSLSTPDDGSSDASLSPPSYRPSARHTMGRWFYRLRPTPPTVPTVNPCDPRSPFFAGNEYSPFHPVHPSNPYSFLNPLNTLPVSDSRSPYNPRSANFAGNPESPYSPLHPMSPFNPDSFLFTCQQTGSLHPMNPRSPFYPLNPRSPYSPRNPSSPYHANHPLLAGLDPAHALNPTIRTSPFHPSHRTSPYNPQNYQRLNPEYPLSPLAAHAGNDTHPLQLGWYPGVKEDWSLVADPPQDPKRSVHEQLLPYPAAETPVPCGRMPPAPPPPRPPYYPGYYAWDPSWTAPRYIRTSDVPATEPIDPVQWQQIWARLWQMKCRRDAAVTPGHHGSNLAMVDVVGPLESSSLPTPSEPPLSTVSSRTITT